MPNPALRVDPSNVSTFADLYSAPAKGVGFEHCGSSNPDGLLEQLTGPAADEVRAAAAARGLTPEEYIRELAADDAAFEAEYNDLSWDEDLRRLEEPGANTPAEELFADIRARLEARVARGK